ncbi:hypothetical protein VPNG_02234 [Cytospora leucostoma]|uniref:Uncharacterized protein n=1 Tax=Cytospora leucostoma TaxID=1230097 RepID=A0A423XH37_9PEZI|nr:hypothetical protein VPNG_02234 [Cytospora leucostoma]
MDNSTTSPSQRKRDQIISSRRQGQWLVSAQDIKLDIPTFTDRPSTTPANQPAPENTKHLSPAASEASRSTAFSSYDGESSMTSGLSLKVVKRDVLRSLLSTALNGIKKSPKALMGRLPLLRHSA